MRRRSSLFFANYQSNIFYTLFSFDQFHTEHEVFSIDTNSWLSTLNSFIVTPFVIERDLVLVDATRQVVQISIDLTTVYYFFCKSSMNGRAYDEKTISGLSLILELILVEPLRIR